MIHSLWRGRREAGWAVALLLSTACASLSFGGEDPHTELIMSAPVQWLKTYSLSPHKEHWSINIEVKDLEKETPKLRRVFEKAGAALTQPLDFFPVSRTEKSQQLSFRSSLQSAQAALKALHKTAAVKELRQRPAAEPISLAEIGGKIEKLETDRKAHAAELAAMPAVSSLVEELLAHLSSVRAIQEDSGSEVLMNVTLKEKAK
jgi:hypothetical protein